MRKNILIFGHSYATQFIDISNQYTRLFDPEKYSVTVAYLVGDPDEAITQKHLATDVIFLAQSRKAIRGLKIGAIRQMLALCRAKQFDTIICHRYKPMYIMLWVAQFCKIGALFSVMHDLKTMQSLPRKLLVTALARKNMAFAGVSDAVRDDMRHDLTRVPTQHIITLYNATDVELTEPNLLSREAARDTLNLPHDAFIFGNIARLVPVKDHATFIQAFLSIKSQCPGAKLVFMGDGELEQSLKNHVATLGLTEDVIFTGFIPDAYKRMKLYDAFVLNSTREAFGRVLTEAMMAKIPIIATRTDGIPEVVGNTGTLIDARQPDQLAKAMLALYQTSIANRHEQGQRGYERMQQYFSIPAFQTAFWQAHAELRGIE